MYKSLRFVVLGALFCSASIVVRAQVCARVVIQIEQELTLEREGFEARLGVSNGQPASLENFSVVLKFSDADGNPVTVATDAAPNATGKFYYRLQAGSSADTTIATGATAKYTYLIVPAPGAAGATADGSIYYVSATVKYTLNGAEQIVEVAPDFIRVRPMPALQLQYFLPGDVYGDDPLTPAISEPIVPFPLGLRVSNHSPYATARRLKIQTGQPEIIDNQRGLLIDFRILGGQVNTLPVEPSLLVNLGDIAPRRSTMANWIMSASLSGKFVRFTAEVTHAPEFGGELTSLIPSDAISTHRLLGRVLVDLPGSDTVPDFLGTDLMVGEFTSVKLYQSDHDQVSEVVDYFGPDHSAVSLVPQAGSYRLSLTSTNTHLFVVQPSPIAADKAVRAVRSDGKVIPPENSWISKTKNNDLQWVYSVNLFDTGKQVGHSYLLTFSDPAHVNRAPVLSVSGGLSFQVPPNTPLSIRVTATDPDGLIPTLSTGDLPDGGAFIDARNGSGVLSWTPQSSQLGTYRVQFRASDGIDADSKIVRIEVTTTIIGGFDEWQKRHWPGITDPAIIGREADPDLDGLNNLLEYALDGDPTLPDETILPEIGTVETSGNRYLALTFRQRTDDPTLLYEVVASENLFAPLSSWTVQTQVLSVTQDNLPTYLRRVRVQDSAEINSGGAHRYLRLRVTQP